MNRTFTLDAKEARVLGVLVEKDLSTPEYYPMTVNALVTACNQKTNRKPVVEYEADDVAEAIESLQRKRLVGSSRARMGGRRGIVMRLWRRSSSKRPNSP